MHEFNHAAIGDIIAGGDRKDRCDAIVISVALSVRDHEALWDAAAIKGMSAPGTRLNDLIDVIGPREDPSIAECIAMLAQPALLPGCDLEDFDVQIVAPLRSRDVGHDLKAA
jgi:hypothetical protein